MDKLKTKKSLRVAIAIMVIYFFTEVSVLLEFINYSFFIQLFNILLFICFSIAFGHFLKEYRSILKATKNQLAQLGILVDTSVLSSRADSTGKITYVNKKFEEVSGWTMEEVLGKDHSLLNSGVHGKEFWTDMYKTVLRGEIWNNVVTNKRKDGTFYYVDTYIKAEFSATGELSGFVSIRQDVTRIIETQEKLQNILGTQTAYVLRTNMQGQHTYWNKKFEDEFGWVYGDKMMNGDALLSICDSHHRAAEVTVEMCIQEPGKIIKVELDKPHKDGSRRTTLWEFVCLTDKNSVPLEIQCMGIDITDRKKAEDELRQALSEVDKKNTFLEHAAKILRHDMHSGINTYIPRGISSLKRRLTPEVIANLTLEAPIRLLDEGLKHTQKVYKSVYEFTNLVKKDSQLSKSVVNLKDILVDYLSTTSYKDQIKIDDLPDIEVNAPLFCTAIDNMIRNGLRYNDSQTKLVSIFMEDEDYLVIQDNGRGITQEEFEIYSQPYVRKKDQKETGSGLGLNISVAILDEHGFSISCQKNDIGTKLKIKVKG